MLFSQRRGLKPAEKALQIEAIDDDLRNSLWSAFHEALIREFVSSPAVPDRFLEGSNLDWLFRAYWLSFFKLPTDGLPRDVNVAIRYVRDRFFRFYWHEVYDFLEFTGAHAPADLRAHFRAYVNSILERENSGYRFVGENITEITSEEEMAEVEEALNGPLAGANAHIAEAVKLLSDRKHPDYRNSIKESISAVEAICRAVTGDAKTTLGGALNVLQAKIGLHPALKASLSTLYGFSSDKGGIRHAMSEPSNVSFSDAKFMLIVCSAFVNFIAGKAAENQLSLG